MKNLLKSAGRILLSPLIAAYDYAKLIIKLNKKAKKAYTDKDGKKSRAPVIFGALIGTFLLLAVTPAGVLVFMKKNLFGTPAVGGTSAVPSKPAVPGEIKKFTRAFKALSTPKKWLAVLLSPAIFPLGALYVATEAIVGVIKSAASSIKTAVNEWKVKRAKASLTKSGKSLEESAEELELIKLEAEAKAKAEAEAKAKANFTNFDTDNAEKTPVILSSDGIENVRENDESNSTKAPSPKYK
jgi:hypothetical protein